MIYPVDSIIHLSNNPAQARASPSSIYRTPMVLRDYEKYLYSPLGGMLVHRGVNPSIKSAGTYLYTWTERGTVRVKYLPRTSFTTQHWTHIYYQQGRWGRGQGVKSWNVMNGRLNPYLKHYNLTDLWRKLGAPRSIVLTGLHTNRSVLFAQWC